MKGQTQQRQTHHRVATDAASIRKAAAQFGDVAIDLRDGHQGSTQRVRESVCAGVLRAKIARPL
jgi:CMP-2-keto-3-deoxyoctulosonic acid synthetase